MTFVTCGFGLLCYLLWVATCCYIGWWPVRCHHCLQLWHFRAVFSAFSPDYVGFCVSALSPWFCPFHVAVRAACASPRVLALSVFFPRLLCSALSSWCAAASCCLCLLDCLSLVTAWLLFAVSYFPPRPLPWSFSFDQCLLVLQFLSLHSLYQDCRSPYTGAIWRAPYGPAASQPALLPWFAPLNFRLLCQSLVSLQARTPD